MEKDVSGHIYIFYYLFIFFFCCFLAMVPDGVFISWYRL